MYLAREQAFEALAHDCGAGFFMNPDINGDAFIGGAGIGVSINWTSLVRDSEGAALRFGILNAVPGQVMGLGRGARVLVACSSGAVEIEEAEVESRSALPAANRYRLGRRRAPA